MIEHLGAIEPDSIVYEICDRITKLEPSYVVKLELEAFLETITRHSGLRLAKALRYFDHQKELADELEELFRG